MSTDIYCYVEVRCDGRWGKVGRIFPNPDWREGDVIQDQPEYGWYHGPLTDELYIRRNYGLFGMLAGVRDPDIEPIVKPIPRGIPDDASPEYRALAKDGGSAASWLTLAELQAYDWDAPGVPARDWDDPAFQPAWEEYNARRVAAGMKPLDGLFDGDPEMPRPPWRMHTRRELAGEFVTETLPRLAELGAPEDVRIVFFFD